MAYMKPLHFKIDGNIYVTVSIIVPYDRSQLQDEDVISALDARDWPAFLRAMADELDERELSDAG